MPAWVLIAAMVGGAADADDLEFFEARIRPILVERCYRCHNSAGDRKGGLALDHRGALLEGGGRGPALVPGSPEQSLLLSAIRHDDGAPRMPRDEPKLEARALADFEEWIRRGAFDPRDRPPEAEELTAETAWERVRERRAQWWSFQPVRRPPVPEVRAESWPRGSVDRFVLAGLEARGLQPAEEADPEVLLRRASLVITGLPPTPAERAAFAADSSPAASYERAVDALLQSPHFGERWARHWMDLFRYAESHGSEGDPGIPHAYRYRDALIRALNADVPYDRLLAEHVAGDLLDPRLDPESELNDAALGVAQFRFVQHGYAPTDAREEQARFIDNQIDVLTKSALGLTVSCARCHDHKFDPVGQSDYYALYGILRSARPGLRMVDSTERRRDREQLDALREEIRRGLASAWRAAAQDLAALLLRAPAPTEKGAKPATAAPLQAAMDGASARGSRAVLGPWLAMSQAPAAGFAARWQELLAEQLDSSERLQRRRRQAAAHWNLGDPVTAAAWFLHAPLGDSLHAPAGAFVVLPEGERILDAVYPAGVFTHLHSRKLGAVFTSPSFPVESESLWIRAFGGGGARARYSVQHYPRVAGPIYKSHGLRGTEPAWKRWDMTYWRGDDIYVEVATGPDLPVEAGNQELSWWGLTEVLAPGAGEEPPRDEPAEFTGALFREMSDPPRDREALADGYQDALLAVIERWENRRADDADARFLSGFVRHGLLPAERSTVPAVVASVDEYREIEALLKTPVRAPGLLPGPRVDQPLLVRGDPGNPAAPIPQRFLEVFGGEPYSPYRDGRLQLADDLVRPDNPLTARVAVNRIWHWVFGRGLVATPDNFGLLGAEPSHPELLDWLASDFVEHGWSIKRLVRALVTSRTFRQGSGSTASREQDPENRWWSRMPPRRLEAEAIRDSMLAVSQRLDPTLYGPPVGEAATRRSVYVAVRRNGLSPFLATFDAPAPFSTTGRRAATNVPAQALALMNDPFVRETSRHWAARILKDASLPDAPARARRMLSEALGREPDRDEVERAVRFVAESEARRRVALEHTRRLQSEIAAREARIAALWEAARQRTLAGRDPGAPPAAILPAPIARWDFDHGLEDCLGDLHGEPVGSPRVEGGRLLLDGDSYVLTRPLGRDLTEKTLEAWVELADLGQRAGGVLTVQTTDGNLFDSIVYAERRPGEWVPGSNHFHRTRDVGGGRETEAGLTHVAITYARDGTVAVYRQGVPYGEAYRSDGPLRFGSGRSQVLLGMRHGTRERRTARIRGSIEAAQLYDRALTAEEVLATSSGAPDFVTRREVEAAFTPGERAERQQCETDLAALRTEWSGRVFPGQDDADAARPWTALAQAIFSLKEFLYLR